MVPQSMYINMQPSCDMYRINWDVLPLNIGYHHNTPCPDTQLPSHQENQSIL